MEEELLKRIRLNIVSECYMSMPGVFGQDNHTMSQEQWLKMTDVITQIMLRTARDVRDFIAMEGI